MTNYAFLKLTRFIFKLRFPLQIHSIYSPHNFVCILPVINKDIWMAIKPSIGEAAGMFLLCEYISLLIPVL